MSQARLKEERKLWRNDHPYGFHARPRKLDDGTLDLTVWECGIPGPSGSLWEGVTYKVQLSFPPTYPAAPPKCTFQPPIYHPNVWPSGMVCLSIIDAQKDWRPSIRVPQVLRGIQALMNEINLKSPANLEASEMYATDKQEYEKRVVKQVASFKLAQAL